MTDKTIEEMNSELNLEAAAEAGEYFYDKAREVIAKEAGPNSKISQIIALAEVMRKDYETTKTAHLYAERTDYMVGTIEFIANAIFDLPNEEPVKEES